LKLFSLPAPKNFGADVESPKKKKHSLRCFGEVFAQVASIPIFPPSTILQAAAAVATKKVGHDLGFGSDGWWIVVGWQPFICTSFSSPKFMDLHWKKMGVS